MRNASHNLDRFRDLSLGVLEGLQERYGMALWMVHHGEEEPVVLQVRDRSVKTYDKESMRHLLGYLRVATVTGPKVEPAIDDASMLAGTTTARRMNIGAFIGMPLITSDDTMVGTLCAVDPEPQPDSLRREKPVLKLVAGMLADMLAAEAEQDLLLRRVERAEAKLQDEATGLYNRQGWERLVEAEDLRCERYARPAGTVILRVERGAHDPGMLHTTGELLAGKTRESDVAARIDDDLFGLLLLETESKSLPKVATRLERELMGRGIPVASGYAPRDPASGFQAAIRAAVPAPHGEVMQH